jgi:hypothetical protein
VIQTGSVAGRPGRASGGLLAEGVVVFGILRDDDGRCVKFSKVSEAAQLQGSSNCMKRSMEVVCRWREWR